MPKLRQEEAFQERRPSVLVRLKPILMFTLAILTVSAGYYYLHVQRKSDYLMSRNFRLLTSMGERIESSVSGQQKILKHLSDKKTFMTAVRGAEQGEEKDRQPYVQRRNEILKVIAPQFDYVRTSSEKAPEGRRVWHKMLPGSDGPTFKFFYQADEAVLEGEVKLIRLVEPAMTSRGAFESVLLADSRGHVIYQQGAPDLGITHLSALTEPKAEKRRGARSEMEVPNPLFGVSDHMEVQLAGKSYRLFVEPFSLSIPNPSEDMRNEPAVEGHRETWLLCGLVPEREQIYRSMAVSSALLMLLIGGLLLAVLSWPFVRLRLIGDWQRVRLLDVALVGICSLAGTSIATLILLDVFAFYRFTVQGQIQVNELTAEIEQRLLAEVEKAHGQLVALESTASKMKVGLKNAGEAAEKENWVDGGTYPFWDNFSLIDDSGMQKVKWSTNTVVPARVDVRERIYYQRVRDDDLWRLQRDGDDLTFFVEPIVSWTTGEKLAVLAKRSSVKGFLASILVFHMPSLIHVVLPPGFEFAVLDSENSPGRVLFHSDPERNLSEDFFAETDQDRRLRSAVFAKRSESMTLRYWGHDYLARIEPVNGLPWTIVTLRERDLLRAVNLEWIVTTISFSLFYIGLMVVLLLLVLTVRPFYRASWLWPDRNRDYYVLSKILMILVAAFGLAIYVLPGGYELLTIAILLPFLAVVTTYLRLGRPSHRMGRNAAMTCGIVLLAVLGWQLLAGHVQGVRSLVLALIALALALAIRWPRRKPGQVISPAQSRYAWAGVLLLILTSVLPTLGFFESARRIQFDSFVKHGQLRLAMSMEERAREIQREARREKGERGKALGIFLSRRLAISDQPARKMRGLDVYAGPFFGTTMQLRARAKARRAGDSPCEPDHESTLLEELFEKHLPRTSEQAVEMRELLHGASSDCTWQWNPGSRGGELKLFSHAYPGGDLILTSWPEPRLPDPVDAVSLLSWLLLVVLLSWLVRFISRHIFLLDPDDPSWPATGRAPSTPRLRQFLVSPGRRWMLDAPAESFLTLDLVALRDASPEAGDRWLPLLRSTQDRDILIQGFRESLMDEGFRNEVLNFLEKLVERHQCRILILSTAYPMYLWPSGRFGSRRLSDEEKRWRALLSSFNFEDEELRSHGESGDETQDLHPVLRKECGSNQDLLAYARKVSSGATPEQLLEELGELAESYYRSLWTSCTQREEAVLEHLAEDGFVSERNRRVVRRLIARGLVRRDPNLQLMNETFRRFVVSSICKSQVRASEREAEPSAWDRLRLPFFIGLASSLVFFFATQQSMLDGSAATVTGLAAGIPALIQMMDLFGGKFPGMR